MNLLQVILPVIIMLIIGMISREKKLISEEGIEGFQTLVMNFTLPISLFYTFYRASIKVDTNHTFRGDSRGNLRWETYM